MKDKEKQEKVFDILDRIEFFQGQSAGRELWNDKPKEVQDQDLADFVRDIKYIRSYLKDSVVLSKKEYEKLKKYEYKVQCGVCFTQKEWFDFINEDSKHRTSLLIEAKEQVYEQAHKEMLKDCIESNKVAEQIGYEKARKETAEQYQARIDELEEEVDMLVKEQKEDRSYEIEQAKKETAEKSINDIFKVCKQRFTDTKGYTCWGDIEIAIQQYAKQVGVEIKE